MIEWCWARGRCPPCTPPLLAGRWPAESLERFAPAVVIMDGGSGGGPAPPAPPPVRRPGASMNFDVF